VTGFVDAVVVVLVLIIAGVTIAFVMNENVVNTPGGQTQAFLAGLGNLWGKALSMMFGG
jgi:hypothetical protein